VVALFVTFLITVAVTLGLGLAYNPVNAFAMVGTGIVIVLVGVYIVVNAACIGYFASPAKRGPGRRWNPLLHLVIPVAGIAAFVPPWLTSAGITAFSFVAPLTPPSSYMGPGVAGFMVVGVIYLIYLYRRYPQRVTEVGLVHIDAPELQPVAGIGR
jgi:amino acid transporter